MRRKAFLLAGAFALVASMAFAQAALASHSTVQSTAQLTGAVVPTYKQCITGSAANTRWHASPIAFASCQNGTDDVNGPTSPLLLAKPFNGSGTGFKSQFVVAVKTPSPGPPTGFGSADAIDVKSSSTGGPTLCKTKAVDPSGVNGWVTAAFADLRCTRPDGSNPCTAGTDDPVTGCVYSGNTIGESTIRVTDADNCPTITPCGDVAGTTQHATIVDFDFSFVVPCTLGACGVVTTADAQFGPSYVVANDPTDVGNRSDVEILSVRSQDSGGNGDAGTGCPLTCGDGDEHDAARQGVFIK